MIKLTIEKRDSKQSLAKLRREGKMPAVFYGKKQASTPIAVSHKDFMKAWKEAGESTVIELKGDGLELEALVQDIDVDPISDLPRHADFYVFEKGQKMEVPVSVSFVGVAPAVKDFNGILVKVLHEIRVSAEPKNLPHEIEVDVSTLTTLDSQIVASDIKLGAGVELAENPEEVVASISVAKEEPVEEVPVDLSAIEVEKKGKEEVEEGAEGEASAKK
ncbi:MAG: 50S ribosomal protein L25 [Candidatus Paceibacterota bacterium]|jgi:large subunit ribosomal protein L25